MCSEAAAISGLPKRSPAVSSTDRAPPAVRGRSHVSWAQALEANSIARKTPAAFGMPAQFKSTPVLSLMLVESALHIRIVPRVVAVDRRRRLLHLAHPLLRPVIAGRIARRVALGARATVDLGGRNITHHLLRLIEAAGRGCLRDGQKHGRRSNPFSDHDQIHRPSPWLGARRNCRALEG